MHVARRTAAGRNGRFKNRHRTIGVTGGGFDHDLVAAQNIESSSRARWYKTEFTIHLFHSFLREYFAGIHKAAYRSIILIAILAADAAKRFTAMPLMINFPH